MKIMTLFLVLLSFKSFAQVCSDSNGQQLTKINDSEWKLTIVGVEHFLKGKVYTIDFNTQHSVLVDSEQNEYSLISNYVSGPSHCRARYCPANPEKLNLKLSINGGSYAYFNCL